METGRGIDKCDGTGSIVALIYKVGLDAVTRYDFYQGSSFDCN